MRDQLIAWQWDGYPQFHQRPITLWLHLLAVPAFISCTLSAVFNAATLHFSAAGGSLVGMLLAFVVQGIAHKNENNPAIPFAGPGDALSRIFLEQFYTFPRFVLTGGWWRALRSGG